MAAVDFGCQRATFSARQWTALCHGLEPGELPESINYISSEVVALSDHERAYLVEHRFVPSRPCTCGHIEAAPSFRDVLARMRAAPTVLCVEAEVSGRHWTGLVSVDGEFSATICIAFKTRWADRPWMEERRLETVTVDIHAGHTFDERHVGHEFDPRYAGNTWQELDAIFAGHAAPRYPSEQASCTKSAKQVATQFFCELFTEHMPARWAPGPDESHRHQDAQPAKSTELRLEGTAGVVALDQHNHTVVTATLVSTPLTLADVTWTAIIDGPERNGNSHIVNAPGASPRKELEEIVAQIFDLAIANSKSGSRDVA